MSRGELRWNCSTHIDYSVDGRCVCGRSFAAVYAIPPATFDTLERNVVRGDCHWVTYASTRTSHSNKTILVMDAEVWWHQRLQCYDIMLHLTGVIIHPLRSSSIFLFL
eukprot:1098133-Pleurochrysis_carterae.AAC.1